MKVVMTIILGLACSYASGQSLVGKWQLVKESTCLEDEVDSSTAEEEDLVQEMRSMSGPGAQVIEFKENNTANESTRIISRRKSYNSHALLYRHSDNSLHILDKKSRLLIESFSVELLSTDSLIISNAARACETRIFVKIK
jgi:hypothetical protein